MDLDPKDQHSKDVIARKLDVLKNTVNVLTLAKNVGNTVNAIIVQIANET